MAASSCGEGGEGAGHLLVCRSQRDHCPPVPPARSTESCVHTPLKGRSGAGPGSRYWGQCPPTCAYDPVLSAPTDTLPLGPAGPAPSVHASSWQAVLLPVGTIPGDSTLPTVSADALSWLSLSPEPCRPASPPPWQPPVHQAPPSSSWPRASGPCGSHPQPPWSP